VQLEPIVLIVSIEPMFVNSSFAPKLSISSLSTQINYKQ
jgi:hypothetical protein